MVRIAAPAGAALRCSLSRVKGGAHRSKRCARIVSFSRLRGGRYRLRITSGEGTVTRRLRVP
jgi:hypothetical protein